MAPAGLVGAREPVGGGLAAALGDLLGGECVGDVVVEYRHWTLLRWSAGVVCWSGIVRAGADRRLPFAYSAGPRGCFASGRAGDPRAGFCFDFRGPAAGASYLMRSRYAGLLTEMWAGGCHPDLPVCGGLSPGRSVARMSGWRTAHRGTVLMVSWVKRGRAVHDVGVHQGEVVARVAPVG